MRFGRELEQAKEDQDIQLSRHREESEGTIWRLEQLLEEKSALAMVRFP